MDVNKTMLGQETERLDAEPLDTIHAVGEMANGVVAVATRKKQMFLFVWCEIWNTVWLCILFGLA